jgi:hypothetical protein
MIGTPFDDPYSRVEFYGVLDLISLIFYWLIDIILNKPNIM